MLKDLRWLALGAFGSLVLGVAAAWFFSVRRWRRLAIALAAALVLLQLPAAVLGLRGLAWMVPGGAVLALLATAPAFARLSRQYGDAARSLGASETRILFRLLVPLSWRWLLLAVLLALYAPLVRIAG